ncbi:hypothetical protein G7Y79_00005g017050 [Physcia stellaris]|nr:hypothetical protein G7Y79_00005g017050 [Physcia stellaris]
MKTMTSHVAPITQAPSRLAAVIASIRHTAAVVSTKTTRPEFRQSFGNELSPIGGQCRWVIKGYALELWQDLTRRVDELLHEKQGVIYRRFSKRDQPITRHCWMLGPSMDCAHPTAVILCNESVLLKRIMRIILEHNFLGEKGFDLKGIPACNVRLLWDPDAVTPLKNPTISYTGRSSEAKGHDPDKYPCFICSSGMIHHDSGRSATLGGVLQVDGTTFGLTAGHILNNALAPQVNTINNQNIVLYGSDWALESPNESEDEDCFGQELEENEPTNREERSPQYVHEAVYDSRQSVRGHPLITASGKGKNIHHVMAVFQFQSTGILGPSSYGQSLRIVAASGHDRSHSGQGSDWALLELPDTLQNKANAVDDYDGYIVQDIEVDLTQGRVILLTRRGQISCIGAGSASSIMLPGSEIFMDVWSLCSEEVLEPGDCGSWAIDESSNKLLGLVVADCNTTGEVFIIPAKAVFADIKLSLPAREVRLPRYHPKHPRAPTDLPESTAHQSSVEKKDIYQPANDLTRAKRLNLPEDEVPIKDIPEELESSWKSSRLGESWQNTGEISYPVCISIIRVLIS